MKKIQILLLLVTFVVSVCVVDAHAALQWYMVTDAGVNIAMENVDYLMRADDSVDFTVVLKNGSPVTGVGSVSFEQQSTTENRVPDVVADVHYYPNPVTDRLCISGVPAGNRVEIVSLDGKLMKSVESGGSEITLPVADLPHGTYLLRTANSTLKFLKH